MLADILQLVHRGFDTADLKKDAKALLDQLNA
jgi:hypothetical protein